MAASEERVRKKGAKVASCLPVFTQDQGVLVTRTHGMSSVKNVRGSVASLLMSQQHWVPVNDAHDSLVEELLNPLEAPFSTGRHFLSTQ